MRIVTSQNNQAFASTQQLRSIIKTILDIMRKDKGLNGQLDRLMMLTWLMFLKFLDDMEQIRETEAELQGTSFIPLIEAPYRWRDWASQENRITGNELIAFINNVNALRPDGRSDLGLFAYLSSLQGNHQGDRRDTIAYIFKNTVNRMLNGYLLVDVIDKINCIQFGDIQTTGLYESLLGEILNSAGDAAEFYTPRPIIRFMVEVINPQLGEILFDPACGTGGFLAAAYEHLKIQCQTVQDLEFLQKSSLIGGEAKPFPFLLAQMNLLLHGLESPQIDPFNSLRHYLAEISAERQVDIILSNPPLGGEEEKKFQYNFPPDKRTSQIPLLFLQLIMRLLKRQPKPGRAAVVTSNGVLFGNGVCARIKEELLREFNLHTIVRLPAGVFTPYTSIPTALLFFDRSKPTEEIWYYEILPPDSRKKYTKTKPLQYEDFAECLAWWGQRQKNEYAWKVSVDDVLEYDQDGNLIAANLDIKNPNGEEDVEYLSPKDIVADILKKEGQITELAVEIEQILMEILPE